MGNVCCKRRGNEPIDNANSSGQREKTDTTGNNMELYLNDVFEKECLFKTEQEEIGFIQTGIETDKTGKREKTDTTGQREKTDTTGQREKTDTTGQREETDTTGQREKTGNTRTNLELYLNDVFKKECIIKAEQEEVGFIQTGIESLVQELVDNVLKSETLCEYFDDLLKSRSGFRGLVEEVYFPIKPESQEVNVIPGRQSIIKVGSIYEGTKNNFPDEFDFIFPLLSLIETDASFWTLLKRIVEKCICSVTGSLCYVPSTEIVQNERKLYFDKYMNRHGPAYKLRFIYNNGSGEETYIHVDLVLAYKVRVNPSRLTRITRKANARIQPKSFKDEAVSLKSNILIVREDLSLTEAEVHFVRNILSQNHKVVYRVLKFLINGHEDHAALEQVMDKYENSDRKGSEYSSYMIKTMMIYHHEECTNSDPATIGPCVLQVLEEMCKYDNVLDFPTIFETNSFKSPNIFLLSGLKSLTACLKSIQTSDDSYDYERTKMHSVTKQYLDTLIKRKD